MSWDPAHDATAEVNRQRKALALARRCWHLGIDSAHLRVMEQSELNRLARDVGVNPPRPDDVMVSATWSLVMTGLDRWAVDSGEPREALHEHGDWCSSCPAPDPCDNRPARWIPKGWETLADLAPIDPERYRCQACDEPAVTIVTLADGGWFGRCGCCPPQPGEWGWRLDWTLRACHAGTTGLRCYCGRHEVGRPSLLAMVELAA